MKIIRKRIADMERATYNPRVELQPGDAEYETLRRSLEQFGMVEPVVWNERTNRVVGGHQRLTVEAALGHEEVDVSVVDLDEIKEKELNIALNKIGGRNGVGITDIVENRLVGMKARGVYETPGGTILYAAHAKLEEICLDKDTLHYKQNVANAFAELVYDGKWYTPLREALSAFVDSTQEYVTGDVKLKLYKGNIIDAGVTSPYSLYDEEIATFDEDQVYDQNDSAGFINLFGLPIKVRAKKGLIK